MNLNANEKEKSGIVLAIGGGVLLVIIAVTLMVNLLFKLDEEEKKVFEPLIEQIQEDLPVSTDKAEKEEKKEEKIGLSIGNIENIENFNVENVIIKEKGRNINIDTIKETE